MNTTFAKDLRLAAFLSLLSMVGLAISLAAGRQKATEKGADGSFVASIRMMRSAIVQIGYRGGHQPSWSGALPGPDSWSAKGLT